MKRNNNEKNTILKLYEDSLNDIIWTHKIQANILYNLKKKNKVYKIIKETLIWLAGFVSVLFLYFEKYLGALICSALSTISIIFDNIFNFSNFENRIRITNENVNNLWHMKKILQMNKLYLESDIIDWKTAKDKLASLERTIANYSDKDAKVDLEIAAKLNDIDKLLKNMKVRATSNESLRKRGLHETKADDLLKSYSELANTNYKKVISLKNKYELSDALVLDELLHFLPDSALEGFAEGLIADLDLEVEDED